MLHRKPCVIKDFQISNFLNINNKKYYSFVSVVKTDAGTSKTVDNFKMV